MLEHRTTVLEALILCLALTFPAVSNAESPAPSNNARIAQADDSVAIVSVELVDAPPEMRARLLAGMHQGLSQAGVGSVPQDQVKAALRDKPELSACLLRSCRKQLGPMIGAARFMTLRVAATGANFQLELTLYDSQDEDPVRRLSTPCDVCSYDDVVQRVTETAKKLVGPPPEMAVEITSAPAGASLSADGQEIGQTPYHGKLAAGAHTLSATLPDYQPAETQVEIKEDADGPQVFHLSLTAATITIVEPAPRPYRFFKWAGAIATLGAFGAGAGWLIVDGNGTCSDSPTCPQVYDTRTQGYIALGAGVALGAFTTWMFIRDRRDARSSLDELALVPTRGGGFARLGWHF
jgi:hypothetical protein